jgi:hypothetical protein
MKIQDLFELFYLFDYVFIILIEETMIHNPLNRAIREVNFDHVRLLV